MDDQIDRTRGGKLTQRRKLGGRVNRPEHRRWERDPVACRCRFDLRVLGRRPDAIPRCEPSLCVLETVFLDGRLEIGPRRDDHLMPALHQRPPERDERTEHAVHRRRGAQDSHQKTLLRLVSLYSDTIETVSSADAKPPAPAPGRPKRRRNADTRRRVEEAAALLFTRDGYTATTMQAIATRGRRPRADHLSRLRHQASAPRRLRGPARRRRRGP